MREFARAFFSTFGAEVEPANGDELVVRLPPDLAQHFGKQELHLVFSAVEMSPYEDLVAYGSRVFEQMVAWLDRRGEMTILELPVRSVDPVETDIALPAGLSLHNVTASAETRQSCEAFAHFVLRLTYTADDRQDELLTLVLDQVGAPHPELVHAYPQAVAWQGDSPPLPIDVCERLAEVAVDLARVHADECVAQIESQLRPRLQKTLLRLSTFYRQRIEELDPEDENTPSIRQQLAQELDQKTADELARQQVHVTITPINWAILSVPYQHWNLTLNRPSGLGVPLALRQNLHDSTTQPIHCHACAEPITCLGLCDNGHVACTNCLHTCVVCDQDVCAACGIQRGRVSGEWVCAQCAITCSTCGHTVLPRHTVPCAACGQVVCDDCSTECPHCEQHFCPDHTVSCAICGAQRCAEQGLTCHTCDASLCESHHLCCPVCGQGCCPSHAETCALCAQAVCCECLHPTGMCSTCIAALMSEPLAQPNILEHIPWTSGYTWHAGQNSMWTVYYGEHRWGKSRLWAVIVADREGEIRYQYRTRLVRAVLDALRARLPLRRQIETARPITSDAGRPGRAKGNRREPMP